MQYFALTDILTRGWTTDAHTTAYSVPHLEYRLKEEAATFDGGVTMVLFFADVDCEQSHAAAEVMAMCQPLMIGGCKNSRKSIDSAKYFLIHSSTAPVVGIVRWNYYPSHDSPIRR